MPPKKTTAIEGDAPALEYTEGEIQLAFALLKRLPRPTYDADAVAAEIGSASGSSVRKRVSLATAKYGWFSAEANTAAGGEKGDGSAAGTPKTPRAKKTPNTSGRKKKLQETEDGADEDEAGTPSKKKPRTARKPKAKTEETVKEEEEEEEGEEVLKVEEDSEVKKQDNAGDDGQI